MTTLYEIYTSPKCPRCDQLKQMMKEKKMPFISYILNIDYTLVDLKEKYPHAQSFPVLVNNGVLIQKPLAYVDGFEKGSIIV